MEELLGEWLSDDGIVASWAKHNVGESHLQWNMLETYDKFIEDKVASLKAYVKALMDDFKTTLQSFEEDIAILKKTVLQ